MMPEAEKEFAAIITAAYALLDTALRRRAASESVVLELDDEPVEPSVPLVDKITLRVRSRVKRASA